MGSEVAVAQKRSQILMMAQRMADEGAHYLWGAEGHKPTKEKQYLYAPVVLDKARIGETSFCAATLTVGGVVYVCAGRCLHPDLKKVSPQAKVVDTPQSDANLASFVDKYGGKANSQYGWGFELTPRVIKGDKIMDYSRNVDLTGKVAWGEGCDDTLHFDCGGFVRWIVKQVCGCSIAGISMGDPSKMVNTWGKPLGTLVAEGDTVLPADILVYTGHIAFATGVPPTPYSKTGTYNLAQAESATEGVNYGKPHRATNQKCIRLSESTLLGR